MNDNEKKFQITSHNQSGGVTAHTVNLNAAPAPTVNANPIYLNQPHVSEYRHRIALTVDSPYPPGNLFIAVRAPSIRSIDLRPQRSGLVMMGHSGNREGMSFANLQQPYGRIHLDVVTAQSEELKIEWDIQ